MEFYTGVVATFDSKSTETLRKIQIALNESVIVSGEFPISTPPHITLFTHSDLCGVSYYSKLEKCLKQIPIFDLQFSSLAYFPSTKVIFLNPKYNNYLQQLRRICMQCATKTGLNLKNSFADPWNPHCTLNIGSNFDEVGAAFSIAQSILDLQLQKPFIAKITNVKIFSYPPFQIEKVFSL